MIGCSKEYKTFKLLKHWKPISKILSAKDLVKSKSKKDSMFFYLYDKTKELNNILPRRKNGEDSFIHPINVVFSLQKAGVKDLTTICGGIVHDYIEEIVDEYKRRNKHKLGKKETELLDKQEVIELKKLEEEMLCFCDKKDLNNKQVSEIIEITKLLTKHKRDFYYRYMRHMFDYPDEEIKEKAILIKLADRMHNILSIECFNEEERIYQCFKNLFILNSVKKYIIEKYGDDFPNKEPLPPLVKLFKRCGKATYDAFLKILHLCRKKKIGSVCSMLQLAFKKFSFEWQGTNKVTTFTKDEDHLMRLFGGVVRKYDNRLRHKKVKFNKKKIEEKKYCKKFFSAYHFNEEQISAIIDYKDAYGLKEVVAYVLYVPEYFVVGFEYSNLFTEW